MVVGLEELTEKALVNILTEPKNSILKQYEQMFMLDGVKLTFHPNAVRAVAQKALELKTGARGLRTILEGAMLDVMFDTPTDKTIESIEITEEFIKNKGDKLKIFRIPAEQEADDLGEIGVKS